MKSKKIISLSLVALLSTGLLSSCSSSSGDSSTGNTTAQLELFSTKPENVNSLQSLVDKFQAANPNVKITVTSPADAQTVLRSRLAKNDIPDIMAVGGDSTYTELQSAGVLLDLSKESFMTNIQPSYLQMLYDVNSDKSTKAFAVPYATNGSGVLYNKDLFAKAGVKVPSTWTEFVNVMKTLNDNGINPFELTFLDAWTCLPPWNSMAPVLEPANFDADRLANKTTFYGTHEVVLENYLTILGYAQSDFMGTSYDDGNKNFAQGQAAMMINGSWAIPEFKKTNPNINVDLFPFPSSDDASKNTVTSGIDVALAVSSTTKYSDVAKKFIDFMLQNDNSQQYINEQFSFSAVKGVEQNDPTLESCKEAIANGKVSNFPDHYYPSGFDLASILSQFVLNYTLENMDNAQNIKETLQNADTQYDAANVQ